MRRDKRPTDFEELFRVLDVSGVYLGSECATELPCGPHG